LTDFLSIEVKDGWKKLCLLGLVFWMIFVAIGFIPEYRKETMNFLFGKWSFTKLPMFISSACWLLYCLYYYLDKRVKLKIDQNGIWTIKYKDVYWTDIWQFNSTEYKMRRSEGDIYYLFFLLKNGKEIKIRLHRMEQNFLDIRSIIEYYAAKHNIIDMGHGSEE
jgi:hypothetical protein